MVLMPGCPVSFAGSATLVPAVLGSAALFFSFATLRFQKQLE